ncbi:3-deoxy-manno-octulosonate cytidylyltransferase [wastewater metagenome]|uniref:3-deoxy-manno-octulosonate cytidylyltransferase n=2 Tax=unclassified sequences TaxID=12908 RepID=A0A5B8RDP3_9ZZZZ|nr:MULTISPECIES: 3-deoxy-manno-octulosonate cytidylyltransferase [Arhodomonas]QEA05604.1 3-deoxy-manno-octulosonate cytidylyltransferase [uncultured organism]
MQAFTVVIPARYASTRLPGKPLIELAGEPMIAHVIRRARESGAARVIVATDDARIAGACSAIGSEVVHTDPAHPTGTDRLGEVVRHCGLADDAIVVNLQGDEPLMPPALLQGVADALEHHRDADIATLSTPLDADMAARPDVVKVVTDRHGYALYFSRAPIPYVRDGAPHPGLHHRHLGVYGYRAGFLRAFASLEPSPLEEAEKLEQLRALWHGYRIHVAPAPAVPGHGVDTPEDVSRVTAALRDGSPE